MLMRIGAAARSSGDLPNALGVYRRAAEMAPQDPAPLIAAGDVLLQMGNINEAIVSFHAALTRSGDTHGAQVGLAKAFLKTGKPELALEPLSKALEDSPDDPKLLMLLGVTKDLAERHLEAQDLYRRGLTLAPADPALTLDLALSLALSGNYSTAIAVLQPLAMSAAGSPRERQTLALIYGLDGNTAEASRISAIDLDATSVQHNISYFQTLRGLSPEARNRAILSGSRAPSTPPTS
jgi:Flp pilus assembly protein TadD